MTMPRLVDSQKRVDERAAIGRRLRLLRREIWGGTTRYVMGLTEMQKQLRVAGRSLENYEKGTTMPAEVLLRLILETSASPQWLLTGEGSMFTEARQAG
jgi:hypothetical protein